MPEPTRPGPGSDVPNVAKASSLHASGLDFSRAVVSPSLAAPSPDPAEHQHEAAVPPVFDPIAANASSLRPSGPETVESSASPVHDRTDAVGALAWLVGAVAACVSLAVQVQTAPPIDPRLVITQVHIPLFWTLGVAGLHAVAAGALVRFGVDDASAAFRWTPALVVIVAACVVALL